jgi:hypothetical protein
MMAMMIFRRQGLLPIRPVRVKASDIAAAEVSP